MPKILKIVFLLFALLMGVITIPLIKPINTTIVVPMLHSSEPIDYTVKKIQELLPNSLVIRPDDPLYGLFVWRNLGEVIFVSHGTKEGILTSDGIMKWDRMAKKISDIPAKSVFILSCYSVKAVEATKKMNIRKNVYGFKGLVDVDEAAYLSVAIIKYLQGDQLGFYKLTSELEKIMIGKIIEPWEYKLWVLSAHYVRNIWWVYWADYQSGYIQVKYTHPNTYWGVDSHYYNIGINDDTKIYGDNFIAHHIPKSTLDAYSLTALGSSLISLGLGILGLLGWLPEPVTKIVGIISIILGILSISLAYFTDNILRDESGSGWDYSKDMYIIGFFGINIGVSFDYKPGQSMWFHINWFPGYFNIYPLWYGSKSLGIGGI